MATASYKSDATLSVNQSQVSVESSNTYCLNDNIVSEVAAIGALGAVSYGIIALAEVPIAAVAGANLILAEQTIQADELSASVSNDESKTEYKINVENGQMNGNTLCYTHGNHETCLSVFRNPEPGETCLNITQRVEEDVKPYHKTNKDQDAHPVPTPPESQNNEIVKPEKSTVQHVQQPVQEVHETVENNSPSTPPSSVETRRETRMVGYQILNSVSTLTDMILHRHSMTSSQFDRGILSHAIHNFDAFYFHSNGVGNLIANSILSGNISDRDISVLVVQNIRLLLKDMPLQMINVIVDMLKHCHVETMFKHLILDYMQIELPIIGEIKVIYSIIKSCFHMFDKYYSIDTEIGGINLTMPVHKTKHCSLSHGIYNVYNVNYDDPMFNIHVSTRNYNNRDAAANAGTESWFEQFKENSYTCTGVPWESYSPEYTHKPRSMFENYQDIRFNSRLLDNWFKMQQMSNDDIFWYNDYLHGGGEKSWWQKHRHEDPVTFMWNIIHHWNDDRGSYTDDDYRTMIIRGNENRSDEQSEQAKHFENVERGNKNNNVGNYSRGAIAMYANYILLMDEISIGHFADIGVSAMTSLAMNSIVYVDNEVDEFRMDPYLYFKNRLKRFISTYKQIWLTNFISNHITSTLCIIIPYGDRVVGTGLTLVSANISMITSFIVSSFNVKRRLNTSEYVFDVVSNSIQVNISTLANIIINKLFTTSTIVSKMLGFVPGIIILGAIRVIKHHAFDKYNKFKQIMNYKLDLKTQEMNRIKMRSMKRIRTAHLILKKSQFCNPYRSYHANKIVKKYSKMASRRKRK